MCLDEWKCVWNLFSPSVKTQQLARTSRHFKAPPPGPPASILRRKRSIGENQEKRELACPIVCIWATVGRHPRLPVCWKDGEVSSLVGGGGEAIKMKKEL